MKARSIILVVRLSLTNKLPKHHYLYILGNIGLHMFTQNKRKEYDLESLWGIGPEFERHEDERNNELDLLEDIISKSSDSISDIEPLRKVADTYKPLKTNSLREQYSYKPKFIQLK